MADGRSSKLMTSPSSPSMASPPTSPPMNGAGHGSSASGWSSYRYPSTASHTIPAASASTSRHASTDSAFHASAGRERLRHHASDLDDSRGDVEDGSAQNTAQFSPQYSGRSAKDQSRAWHGRPLAIPAGDTLQSPLFDCVAGGITPSYSINSDPEASTSIAANAAISQTSRREKELPKLPPVELEEDDGALTQHTQSALSPDDSVPASPQRSGKSAPRFFQAQAESALNRFTRSKNARRPTREGSDSKGLRGHGSSPSHTQDDKRVANAANGGDLSNYNGQEYTSSLQRDGSLSLETGSRADAPASPNRLDRSRVKGAGQLAGAGLKKWGMASAARLKQVQQARPSGAGRDGSNGIVGMWNRSTSNLRKQDGLRSAKSLADFGASSVEYSEVPPTVPSLLPPPTSADPSIGLPTDVRHNVHVDVGPRGYTGLPESWAQVLAQFGFNADDVKRDPENAADVVRRQTRYFLDMETERGQHPEDTKRLLEHKLYEYRNLRHAVDEGAVEHRESLEQAAARTPAHWQNRTTDNATKQDQSSPRLNINDLSPSMVSPVLPQVFGHDEDWGSSLLQSLPGEMSGSSGAEPWKAADADKSASAVMGDASVDSSADHFREIVSPNDLESGSDGARERNSPDEEPFIMTASKVSAAKATRGPQWLPHSSSFDGQRSNIAQRESEGRGKGDALVPSGTTRSSLALEKRLSPSVSSERREKASSDDHGLHESWGMSSSDTRALTERNPEMAQGVQAHSSDSNHKHMPALVVAAPAGRGRASSESHTAGSDHEQQLSSALRERRRGPPRIYPPSAHRFLNREDEAFARSAGFKAPLSSGRRSSSQSTSQRESPLLTADRFVSHDGASGRNSASAISRASIPSGRQSDGSIRSYTPAHSSNSLAQRASRQSHTNALVHPRSSAGSPILPSGNENKHDSHSSASARQNIPELIHPDANGFYKSPTIAGRTTSPLLGVRDTLERGAESPSMLSPSVSPLPSERADNHVFRSSYHTFAANSNAASQSGAGESVPASSPRIGSISPGDARRDSSDSNMVTDDYEPASDFIDGWLESDGPSRRESSATADLSSHDELGREAGNTRAVPGYDGVPDMPALPSNPSSLLQAEYAPSGKHQSPSPALLLGLPAGVRGDSPTLHSLRGQVNPSPSSFDMPSKQEEVLKLHENVEKATEEKRDLRESQRDWRTRSLPPPPQDDDDNDDDEQGIPGGFSTLGEKRVSTSSLPDQNVLSESGPPVADSKVMDAATSSRPSSRQSRTSSRVGRRAPRRSDDARRFPVSTHYASGFDAESFGKEGEANFSQLMRDRQSVNLDDVLPSDLDRDIVPPVPPIPSLGKPNSRLRVQLPPGLERLSGILRPEDPSEVLGDTVMIGEGESGDVFSSIPRPDTSVQSFQGRGKVAIKIVKTPREPREPSSVRLANLDKELTLWRSVLPHQNIVEIIDAFQSTNTSVLPGIWLVQEFMSMSLADVIALGASGLTMTEEQMSRILLDVVQGLEHLHRCAVVHRDIRSDNVLLTFDGLAKVSDFTHAVQLTPQHSKRSSVVGTAYWMAPEVVKADAYDYKADVWSFGVVIYEMLSGSPPRVEFPALRAITLTAKLGLPALPQPQCASPLLQGCMVWCTKMDPRERPTTEILEASEYFSRAGPRATVAALIEDARALECDIMSTQDEEELAEQYELPAPDTTGSDKLAMHSSYASSATEHVDNRPSTRASWTSSNTAHA